MLIGPKRQRGKLVGEGSNLGRRELARHDLFDDDRYNVTHIQVSVHHS